MKKLILVLSVLALFVLVGCVPTEPQTQEELEAQMDSDSGAIAGQAVAGSDGGAFPAGCTGTAVFACRTDAAIGRTYYKTTSASVEAIAMDRCPTATTAAKFSCQGSSNAYLPFTLLKCTTSCPSCQRTAAGVQCAAVNDQVAPAPVAPRCINRFVNGTDSAVNASGTFVCPGNDRFTVSNGKTSTGWCRTDNTTYSGCMPLATHLSQCGAANTCRN